MKNTDYYKPIFDLIRNHIDRMILVDRRKSLSLFSEELCIERLCGIASMERRNFQLLFKGRFKEVIGKHIKRLRLERAKYLLKTTPYSNMEISEILGYSNPSAFYKEFKNTYGMTPVQFKKRIGDQNHSSVVVEAKAVLPYRREIIPPFKVLFKSYIGRYENYTQSDFEKESWDDIIQYGENRNWLSEEPGYWGICFDDTDISDPDKCRFYSCVDCRLEANPKKQDAIKSMDIEGGEYAIYLYRGSYENLDYFYDRIMESLPYRMDTRLILEKYLNSPCDTDVDQLETEIYIPVY